MTDKPKEFYLQEAYSKGYFTGCVVGTIFSSITYLIVTFLERMR